MVLLHPIKLFRIPFTSSCFWISAKIDMSTVRHFVGGFLLAFLGYGLSFGTTVGQELSDGTGSDACVGIEKCKEGFDLIDFLAGLVALIIFRLLMIPNFDLIEFLLNLI